MARRRSRSRTNITVNALPNVDATDLSVLDVSDPLDPFDGLDVEDRRFFAPDPWDNALSTSGIISEIDYDLAPVSYRTPGRRLLNLPGYRQPQKKLRRAKIRRGRDGRPMRSTRSNSAWSNRYGFVTPRSVAICIRRKVRRSVLLAAGRGGAHHTKRKRNSYSEVRC